ncbi:MAG: peptide chain release factor N(5)-glutamine methyltransferase [Lentimicrobium sp.]|nr:peptide chain release factor N(5)-glutamine methyltransferase [Lentimicrobium sp.]
MTNRQLEKKVYQALLPLYGHNESLSMKRLLFSTYHRMQNHEWLLMLDKEASPLLLQQIETALTQLLAGVPVQYVTGKTWFSELELMVGPGVLIPRPETEELVNLIANKHTNAERIDVLDIGTGSGAIALGISSKLGQARLTAIDFSDTAISYAKANAQKLNIEINLLKTDIFNEEDCSQLNQFDIIVSNPPYVRESEKAFMHRNVLDYEPPEALFVPDLDPLLYYHTIINFSLTHLKNSGELWFEINELESPGISELLKFSGFGEIHIFKDFKGKERFISSVIRI